MGEPVFRPDLSQNEQQRMFRCDDAIRRHSWHESQWRMTCASIDSHRLMLTSLVAEAIRYRRTRGYPLSAEVAKNLLREVHSAMRSRGAKEGSTGGSDQQEDRYIHVLTQLASMRLFSLPRETASATASLTVHAPVRCD